MNKLRTNATDSESAGARSAADSGFALAFIFGVTSSVATSGGDAGIIGKSGTHPLHLIPRTLTYLKRNKKCVKYYLTI